MKRDISNIKAMPQCFACTQLVSCKPQWTVRLPAQSHLAAPTPFRMDTQVTALNGAGLTSTTQTPPTTVTQAG